MLYQRIAFTQVAAYPPNFRFFLFYAHPTGASPMAGTEMLARLLGLQNEPSVGPVAPAIGPRDAETIFTYIHFDSLLICWSQMEWECIKRHPPTHLDLYFTCIHFHSLIFTYIHFHALSCAFMRFPTEQPESARKLQ